MKLMLWFSLPILSETYLVLRRIQRVIIMHVRKSVYVVPVILVRFEWNLAFPVRFSKNTQSTKIHPLGSEMFHADGRTEANSRFSQFFEGA